MNHAFWPLVVRIAAAAPLAFVAACDPASATLACTTGEQEVCGCPEGLLGFQTCDDAGVLGECVCPAACEPQTCGEAFAQCGAIDDGCGGTVACGVCPDTQVCVVAPGGNVCGCGTGRVLLGDTCDVDECAAGLDDCDENASCENTIDGFACTCNAGFAANGAGCDVDECVAGLDNCDENATCTDTQPGFFCTCNSGFFGSGTSCAVDPSEFIADVSARPIPVTIGTLGTFTVQGLSRISIDVGFTRVDQGRLQTPLANGINRTPEIDVARIRGTPQQIDALLDLAGRGEPTNARIVLNNVPFEESADVVLSAVVLEMLDSTTTTEGEQNQIALVRLVPTAPARLENAVNAADRTLPQPQNQVQVEVTDLFIGSTDSNRYTLAEAPAWNGMEGGGRGQVPGGVVVLHGAHQLAGFWAWTEDYLNGVFRAEAMSRIELDDSDNEVFRVNCFEAMPASFVVFEPTRPWGFSLMSDVIIAVAVCEHA